jgi:hypothetical protein
MACNFFFDLSDKLNQIEEMIWTTNQESKDIAELFPILIHVYQTCIPHQQKIYHEVSQNG